MSAGSDTIKKTMLPYSAPVCQSGSVPAWSQVVLTQLHLYRCRGMRALMSACPASSLCSFQSSGGSRRRNTQSLQGKNSWKRRGIRLPGRTLMPRFDSRPQPRRSAGEARGVNRVFHEGQIESLRGWELRTRLRKCQQAKDEKVNRGSGEVMSSPEKVEIR